MDDTTAREHYVVVGYVSFINADPANFLSGFHPRPSSLRDKWHESLSDPKYEGVRVSRKELEEDEEGLSDDTDDTQEQPVTSDEEVENRDEGQADQKSHTDATPEHLSGPVKEIRPAPQKTDDQDLSSTLKRTREEERRKGKAVSRQLVGVTRLLSCPVIFMPLLGHI